MPAESRWKIRIRAILFQIADPGALGDDDKGPWPWLADQGFDPARKRTFVNAQQTGSLRGSRAQVMHCPENAHQRPGRRGPPPAQQARGMADALVEPR